MGATVIACADVARVKAKPATAINLIIVFLRYRFLKNGPNLTGGWGAEGKVGAVLTEQAQTIS
jgi:hypothetical protein